MVILARTVLIVLAANVPTIFVTLESWVMRAMATLVADLDYTVITVHVLMLFPPANLAPLYVHVLPPAVTCSVRKTPTLIKTRLAKPSAHLRQAHTAMVSVRSVSTLIVAPPITTVLKAVFPTVNIKPTAPLTKFVNVVFIPTLTASVTVDLSHVLRTCRTTPFVF